MVKTVEEPVKGYNYSLLERIKLHKPKQIVTTSFEEVITKRRSVREFKRVTLGQLGDLLWYTAKVKSLQIQENGYILTLRGTPSAGARHPIDIIIYDPKLFGKEHFYYYNPFDHSVNEVQGSDRMSAGLVAHINEIVSIKQGMIVWFIAHLERTTAKYANAESLVWRDTGGLINSIQLTCTAIGMNCCPIGSLGEPYITEFFAYPGVFGAGGIIIG